MSEVILYPDSTVRVVGTLQDGQLFDYHLTRGVGKPDEVRVACDVCAGWVRLEGR